MFINQIAVVSVVLYKKRSLPGGRLLDIENSESYIIIARGLRGD